MPKVLYARLDLAPLGMCMKFISPDPVILGGLKQNQKIIFYNNNILVHINWGMQNYMR